MFIYTIIAHWYIIVAVVSITVVFWVFKGLDDSGVLNETKAIFKKVGNDSIKIAKYCTPKIRDLHAVWDCISEIDSKEITVEDKSNLERLKNTIKPNGSRLDLDVDTIISPYSQLINK